MFRTVVGNVCVGSHVNRTKNKKIAKNEKVEILVYKREKQILENQDLKKNWTV